MKKNKKSSHAGMTHVNHDMFLNKDGFKVEELRLRCQNQLKLNQFK